MVHVRHGSMPSLSQLSTSTSAASFSGSQSVCSSTTSISTVGESIPREQRPKLVQPGLKTPSWANLGDSGSKGRRTSSDSDDSNSDAAGVMSTICATSIRAPLALVAAMILDARSYPKWNLFVPRCTVTHQPRSVAPLPPILKDDPIVGAIANLPTTLRDGTSFTMEYTVGLPRDHNLDPLKAHYSSKIRTSPTMQVSALEQFERDDGRVGVRIAWRVKGRFTSRLVRSERVQEIVPSLEDPSCVDYVCWETFYGFLAANYMPSQWAGLKDGYAAQTDGLRKSAEAKAEANIKYASSASPKMAELPY